ncbi:MAG: hypothetical protein ACRCYV_11960 [Aeromonas sp.]
MKTALALLFSWLLALLPTATGWRPLLWPLFGLLPAPDNAQLVGLAAVLLTFYFPSLGVEVVLRRRFQLLSVLALELSWLQFLQALAPFSRWQALGGAFIFHWLVLLVTWRGLTAFTRCKNLPS